MQHYWCLYLCTALLLSGCNRNMKVFREGENFQRLLNSIGNDRGVFITVETKQPSRNTSTSLVLGEIGEIKNFAAEHRIKSCWLYPATGTAVSAIPVETQFLLIRHSQGEYLLLIPLVDRQFRTSLYGNKNNELCLNYLSGNKRAATQSFKALYALKGTNPYGMVKAAMSGIQQEIEPLILCQKSSFAAAADSLGSYNCDAFDRAVLSNTGTLLHSPAGRSETSGTYIFANAHANFWLGGLAIPDWDRYKTLKPSGAFQAAARAISGGLVSSTDSMGDENRAIHHQLVMTNGRPPRCTHIALPSPENLFSDPTRDQLLFKIFNRNQHNYVLGAFNCTYSDEQNIILDGTLSTCDIPGIAGKQFAVYQYSTGVLSPLNRQKRINVQLGSIAFDLFTFAPISRGFAPIGLIDMYNPGGTIEKFSWHNDRTVQLSLLDGGTFKAYSESKPLKVRLNNQHTPYQWEAGTLTVSLPQGTPINLEITL